MRARIHVLLHRHMHIHICMYTYMYMFTYMHLNLHCGRDGRLHSEYSRIRSSMLAYARVRSSMLEYARVCSSMPEHARVRWSMLEYIRVFFCGYADRPGGDHLGSRGGPSAPRAREESARLGASGASERRQRLAMELWDSLYCDWRCDWRVFKPDGDQLAKAGPQQSDRCMELYALQWVADGSNQKLFDATACFESFRCMNVRAFLFPAVHVFCW